MTTNTYSFYSFCSVCAHIVALKLILSGCVFAASIDQTVIDDPQSVILDRTSASRWESLFKPSPRWVTRQVAYLENKQPNLFPSLAASRLLYAGDPWTYRRNESAGVGRWKTVSADVRAALLRAIRWRRDPALADYLVRYLTIEEDPALAFSALVDLWLIDSVSAPTWALRLADPRLPTHLAASASPAMRQRCLAFLTQIRGLDAQDTRQAFDWALLRASGTERTHAIALIPRGAANDLISAVILRLAAEHRTGILDDDGKTGLVLALSRLTGFANQDMVNALMQLAVRGDRATAASAATALATSVSWDAAVAINDLAQLAQKDPDPVVRQMLLAFLMRLYPSAVAQVVDENSPWTELANHH